MNKNPRFLHISTIFILTLLVFSAVCAQSLPIRERSWTLLSADYEKAKKQPCGERAEAVRIGNRIIERFASEQKFTPQLQDYFDDLRRELANIDYQDNLCRTENSLETLFEKFKSLTKAPCGDRENVVFIGKEILERYGDDALNQDVIQFVEKKIPLVQEQDRICQRNRLYDRSYRNKNWREFLRISREILNENSYNPLALDIMLNFVSVGYDLAAHQHIDTYNNETVDFAEKSIALIEAGVKTQKRWGVFDSYETRENALSWMNYAIGYIKYFRFKENKKAIPYFYQATRYKSEFKFDAFIYQAVAIYYFDKAAALASVSDIRQFIARAEKIAQSEVDDSDNSTANFTDREIAALYRNLANLYSLRYNLEPDESVISFEQYIDKLINRPLLDLAKETK